MGNEVIADKQQNGQITADPVLKATSLLYFKEALLDQQYEECAALVRAAKGFGAQQAEIRRIIDEVILQDGRDRISIRRFKPGKKG